MLDVPAAARLSCWLNAWLSGRESADATIAAVAWGVDHVDFRITSEADPLPTALLLRELRRLAVARVSLALPLPGDPVGLAGPSAFNAAAFEVGEAVLLHGPGVGMVPVRQGPNMAWLGTDARMPTYLPDIGAADRRLRAALLAAADRLAELDVASWSPDTADAVLNLSVAASPAGPMALPSAVASRMSVSALRCTAIVKQALRDHGGAATGNEMAARSEALRDLQRAAHAALVAACSSRDGR